MAINSVADGYYELVKTGKRTMKQVPSGMRAEIQVRIDADAETGEQQSGGEA